MTPYNVSMKAVWLEGGALDVREVDAPEPPEGEALLRVVLAGVCGTDLQLLRGYYPFAGVPGHEFVGVVEDGPQGWIDDWLGRRVVGEINTGCRQCNRCQRGNQGHCDSRTVLGLVGRNGAFADFLTLPIDNLHPVPDDVPDEAAVLVEPLAAALRVTEQVALEGRRVLVVGPGRLGYLMALVAREVGVDLAVLGRSAGSLGRIAAEGIEAADDVENWPEGSFDVAIDCTGSPDGLALARHAVAPTGAIVLKSTYAASSGAPDLDLSPLVVDEVRLVGSRCGPFGMALDWLEQRRIRPQDLIDARYPLEEAAVAFEAARQPGTLKVLLAPGDRPA